MTHFCNMIYHPMYFSRAVFKVLFPTAPITVSFFSPLLKIMTVGILLMPYLVAMPGLSSVLSLRHRTWPTYSEASSSIRGAIMRQGPHHGAQKSTRTGISLFKTSVSQVASFTTPATAQFQSNKSMWANIPKSEIIPVMTDNDIVAGTDTIFTFLTTNYNYEVV